MKVRKLSLADQIIDRADRVVRAVTGTVAPAERDYPAENVPEAPLSRAEQQHAAGLMRVNHTGEVCAQALYVGQGLMSRNSKTYETLSQAAREEGEHLAWCVRRLNELEGRPSYLNGVWFAGAFAIGVVAAAAGDRVSMAFVEETERQVVRHLDDHLAELPADDARSRALVAAMRVDEAQHADHAARSAAAMPAWVARLMALEARVMTTLAYRF